MGWRHLDGLVVALLIGAAIWNTARGAWVQAGIYLVVASAAEVVQWRLARVHLRQREAEDERRRVDETQYLLILSYNRGDPVMRRRLAETAARRLYDEPCRPKRWRRP